jgi:hypothetical protein
MPFAGTLTSKPQDDAVTVACRPRTACVLRAKDHRESSTGRGRYEKNAVRIGGFALRSHSGPMQAIS